MSANQQFREICRRNGLAGTYQRQVIYETVMTPPGHPSAEAIYDCVRKRIPGISLATVYKKLKIFIDHGVLGQVSMHSGSLRVEGNPEPHHHLVCTGCRSIVDLKEEELEPIRFRQELPDGFQAQRVAIDILGLCRKCAGRSRRRKPNSN